MRVRMRTGWGVAAAAVLGLALAGCGQSSDVDRAESQSSPQASEDDSVVEPTEARAQGNGPDIVDPGDDTGKKSSTSKHRAKKVSPGAYADGNGSYYFQSASNKHICRIGSGEASCTSFAFPKAPKVLGPDGQPPKVKPDSISSSPSQKAYLWVSSDPSNALRGDVSNGHARNTVLPYGSVLSAGGARCTVEEDTGVACKTGPHGFRLASSGYQLW